MFLLRLGLSGNHLRHPRPEQLNGVSREHAAHSSPPVSGAPYNLSPLQSQRGRVGIEPSRPPARSCPVRPSASLLLRNGLLALQSKGYMCSPGLTCSPFSTTFSFRTECRTSTLQRLLNKERVLVPPSTFRLFPHMGPCRGTGVCSPYAVTSGFVPSNSVHI